MHLITWCLYYERRTAFVVDTVGASSAFYEISQQDKKYIPRPLCAQVFRGFQSHDDVGSNGILCREEEKRSGGSGLRDRSISVRVMTRDDSNLRTSADIYNPIN